MKLNTQHIIYSLLFCFGFFFCNSTKAQHSAYDTVRVYAYVTAQGDTIPMSYLQEVVVYTKLTTQQKKYWQEWTRLRNAVYVTYPLAVKAGRIMNEINAKLVGVKDKKQRKKIIRSREKELRAEFTDKLTNLSIYQGKILMKLINRQTGNSCYEIVDEYKGSFNAVVYQSVAVLFGTSLKQGYEATGKDADIEKIVKDVERMYGYKG